MKALRTQKMSLDSVESIGMFSIGLRTQKRPLESQTGLAIILHFSKAPLIGYIKSLFWLQRLKKCFKNFFKFGKI